MKEKNQMVISLFVFLLILVTSLLGYYAVKNSSQTTSSVPSDIVANTSFGPILNSDVEALGGVALQAELQKINMLKRNIISEILIEKEARNSNLSVEEYFKKKIGSKVFVSDIDVNEEYEKIIKQYPKATRDQVRKKLQYDKTRAIQSKIVEELFVKYEVEMLATKTLKINIPKNSEHAIEFGSKTAPLHVTVFSDYLCLGCKNFHEKFEKKWKAHKDLLYVQFRHYPHRNKLSKRLAEYSICMDKQDKFMEFSDIIYSNQRQLSIENLSATIQPIDYNKKTLLKCIGSGKGLRAVDIDLNEAHKYKLSSTPTIILNGVAANFEELNRQIDAIQNK
ncbi:hypothetical protein DID76_04605 [Candidatus Marinamargulisbacteria bacterium SCGC AG-414-C22]|nr:hypothetical protein DID76_04605 [Candidatus Marinamargulisbacteria bacterium SCGC AG-414-C22]